MHSCVTTLAYLTILTTSALGDDLTTLPPQRLTEADRAAVRLEYMMSVCRRYDMQIGDPPVSTDLHSQPVFRWWNPLADVKDGALTFYGRDRRPEVLVTTQLHHAELMHIELCALTAAPVTLSLGGEVLWHPEKCWGRLRQLADAPPPASRPSLRLVQMRRIAEGFAIEDLFGWKPEEAELHTLRLIPHPAYRYDVAGEVEDGVLFLFALGTDPEAVLQLEVQSTGEGRRWFWALFPTTIYRLTAKRDDQIVWEKPREESWMNVGAATRTLTFEPSPGDLDAVMPTVEKEDAGAR